MTGTITALRHDKGYGFIRSEAGADLFFHARTVVVGGPRFDELFEGQRVEYELDELAERPRAWRVQAMPMSDTPREAR